MVTLPAKLMTIHPFHFIHLLFLLLTKDHKAMLAPHQQARKMRGARGICGSDNIIVPPNQAAREHIIKGPPFNFRIQFFHGRKSAQPFPRLRDECVENDVKLYGEENLLSARRCVDGDLAMSSKRAASEYTMDRWPFRPSCP
jgi:hypothetical protein